MASRKTPGKTPESAALLSLQSDLESGLKINQYCRLFLNEFPGLISAVSEDGEVLFASRHHLQLASLPDRLEQLLSEEQLYPLPIQRRFDEAPREKVLRESRSEWEMSAQHKDGVTHHYKFSQHLITPQGGGKRIVFSMGWEVVSPELTRLPNADSNISYLSFHDPITGLANRSLFYDRVQKSLSRAKRNQGNIALMLVDLDRFKSLNDNLGHDAGDLFLKHAAQKLAETLRDTDTVARLGSDEFVLILENISQPRDIENIANKILQNLSVPVMIDGHEISLTSSIGVSLFPKDGNTIDQLMRHADLAMYRAKSQGKNRWQFFIKAMTDNAVNYLLLENDLRRAIENHELTLHYQPQINLYTGRIIGLEALVRWNHRERGMISPVEFIPLAEETGLIEPLGLWVMKEACERFQSWLMQGLHLGKIAVNLSPRQFRQEHFEESVIKVLSESRLAPHYLELEITESSAMENAAESISMLKCLSKMGLSLAIDDFGTGYSSLSYLKKFPIQKLKIDRSFIKDVDSDDADAAIAKSIIDLAHNMSLQVVAEGVERATQSRWLIDKGCDQVQGFYYSKPLSEEDLMSLVNDTSRALRDDTGVRLLI